MNSSQFQELQMQKMQRLLQEQMQAQLRQQQPQQTGARMSQQAQMMSSGSFGSLPHGIGQVQQSSQFTNQQWMDPSQQQLLVGNQQSTQRNSFSGMSSAQAAVMLQQQQQVNQNSMGMSANNSSLYWNMQGNQKGGPSGLDSTSNLAGLGSINMGSGNSQQLNGLVDSQMQALLQRQSMGNRQSSQMLGMNSQQQLGSGKTDLTNAMSMMNQQQQMQHQMSQLQKMQASSSTVLGRTDLQNQSNTGSSPAQVLLQQQNMIAELKRRLQAQQGGSNTGSFPGNNSGNLGASSNLLGTGMNDHRSSSSSIQQQTQLLDLQQRGSSNSVMMQQAIASGMIQDPNLRGSSSSATMIQNSNQGNAGGSHQLQQRNSFNSSEPISIAALMGQGQNSMDLSVMGRRGSNTSLLGIFDHSTGNSNNSGVLLQQQAQLQQLAAGGNLVGLGSRDGSSTNRAGSVNEQMLPHQHQQILNANVLGSSGSDMQQTQQLLVGQSNTRNSVLTNVTNPNLSSSDLMTGFNDSNLRPFGSHAVDLNIGNAAKASSLVSGTNKKRRTSASRIKKGLNEATSTQTSGGQSFLDGTFNGGWQCNEDIPDRRQVIFSICKLIEQMRPDVSKMSDRLPFMAKRLEEHLYRSAQTKEEYLDASTLKSRLQEIALGLDVHRSSSDESKKDSSKRMRDPVSGNSLSDSSSGLSIGFNAETETTNSQQMFLQEQLKQMQQLQQLQQQQQLVSGSTGNSLEALLKQQQLKEELLREQNKQIQQQSMASGPSGGGMQEVPTDSSDLMAMVQRQQVMMQFQSASANTSQNKSAQGILKTSSSKYDPQKRQVLKQQQQRLLLLRHASKCREGSACKVKFCSQMISLWKHMKKCRDKDCKTAHCLSSRCVLNHYRICKAENNTQSCEVCGPVMRQIKEHHPSTEEKGDAPDQNISQDATDRQQLQGGNNSSAIASVVSDSSVQQDTRKQIQELQAAQQKIQQKRTLLNHVQAQQLQLLEQQRQLEQEQLHVLPQTPKAQQLQEQQLLLQQILQEFQQQAMRLQEDIMRESLGSNNVQNDASLASRSTMSMQGPQNLQGSQMLLGELDQASSSETNLTMGGLRADSSRIDQGNVSLGKHFSSVVSHPLERQLSSNTIGNQPSLVATARRCSLGKRLSALENISRSTHVDSSSNVGIPVSDSFDTEAPAIKSIEQGAPFNSGQIRSSDCDDAASEIQRPGRQKRVLQHGDANHTLSFIPSMSKSDLEEHLRSLEPNVTAGVIAQKLLPVVRRLLQDQLSWVFRDPVDVELLRVYDYYDVVKNPMCLTQVEQNLESGLYQDMDSAEADIRLVFDNAILYNGTDSIVGGMASSMIQRFEKELQSITKGENGIEDCPVEVGDVCKLCKMQRRHFEPSMLCCRGICGMQRIGRNSCYYAAGKKSSGNIWCVNCYTHLEDDMPLVLEDGTEVRKCDLQKFKNDSMPEEAWVQCDSCESWIHQICALFNGRKVNTFSCPKCHLAKLNLGEVDDVEVPMKTAKDIPHCEMSEAIEKGLQNHLLEEYEARAKTLGVSTDQVEKVEELHVRVISNVEKTHVVREQMYKRYSKRGCPVAFPVRSKCIALFQKLFGVDVMLFVMYVFEYDLDCPAPNRRRVYISCVDSVKYLQPVCYRTATYQALIIEYLRYVKDRGFHTAHLWSCPPPSGDKYVFNFHPSKQLIPTDDWLRKWFLLTLEKAKAKGIVLEVRTLYDDYFRNDGADSLTGQASEPTCLPYFEGDYIPGEIENIISEIVLEEDAKNKNRDDSPLPMPSNRGGNKKGTRSNPGELLSVGQDKVMLRLGLAISNMHHNFMVVHLHSRAFAARIEKGDDISQWNARNDDPPLKRLRVSEKVSSTDYPSMQASNGFDSDLALKAETDFKDKAISSSFQGDHDSQSGDSHRDGDVHSLCSNIDGDSFDRGKDVDEDPMNAFDESNTTIGDEVNPVGGHDIDSEPLEEHHRDTNDEAETRKGINKRGLDEVELSTSSCVAVSSVSHSTRVGNTSDPDKPDEGGVAESRQQLLDFCQANHFQFDELRRAKHSTMMILDQLLNPSVQFCDRTRERHRQQQEHMDDRRRQVQNQLCREGSATIKSFEL